VGSDDHRTLDLGVLRGLGVRLAGRLLGVEGHRALLADDLATTIAAADVRLARLLRRIDAHAELRRPRGLTGPEPVPPIHVPASPKAIDLRAEGIRTVVWATGYRREYPWLRVPVLDRRGEIVHDGGITPVPGVYVLGLQFLRRRKSSFLDGVGDDARVLAGHLHAHLLQRRTRAA
jgi:putative flavoprotein involved in K+ transport